MFAVLFKEIIDSVSVVLQSERPGVEFNKLPGSLFVR